MYKVMIHDSNACMISDATDEYWNKVEYDTIYECLDFIKQQMKSKIYTYFIVKE